MNDLRGLRLELSQAVLRGNYSNKSLLDIANQLFPGSFIDFREFEPHRTEFEFGHLYIPSGDHKIRIGFKWAKEEPVSVKYERGLHIYDIRTILSTLKENLEYFVPFVNMPRIFKEELSKKIRASI
jgi:hypothetical protein